MTEYGRHESRKSHPYQKTCPPLPRLKGAGRVMPCVMGMKMPKIHESVAFRNGRESGFVGPTVPRQGITSWSCEVSLLRSSWCCIRAHPINDVFAGEREVGSKADLVINQKRLREFYTIHQSQIERKQCGKCGMYFADIIYGWVLGSVELVTYQGL